MNKIDEMIRELCPEGVKRVPIGSVIKRCRNKSKGIKADVYSVTNNRGFVKSDSLHDFSIYSDDTSNYSVVRKYNIAYNPSRLNIGSIALFQDEIGLVSPMYVVFEYNVNEINPYFLFYTLKSNHVMFWVDAKKEIGARFRFEFEKWNQITIPLPPLAIQQEIVSILDSFSSLQSKLEEELAVRQKQMEFYREKLLTFDKDDNSVKWMKVSEISTKICSGGTPNRSVERYFSGDILWLRTQEVDWNEIYDTEIKITEEAVANSSAKIIPANCVIIAMYGATAGKACINKVPLTTNQACCNVAVNGQVAEYKYLYYYICSRYEHIKGLGEGSQNNINAQKIKEYPIPIPPLSRQQEIVSTLDTMSSLIDKLKEEIELRKKQYEYYREALLSF